MPYEQYLRKETTGQVFILDAFSFFLKDTALKGIGIVD
jgi:hypothetical protein